MDKKMVEERIRELKENQRAGEEQLRQFDLKRRELEGTLLRIGGAIQVLEELLQEESQNNASS